MNFEMLLGNFSFLSLKIVQKMLVIVSLSVIHVR